MFYARTIKLSHQWSWSLSVFCLLREMCQMYDLFLLLLLNWLNLTGYDKEIIMLPLSMQHFSLYYNEYSKPFEYRSIFVTAILYLWQILVIKFFNFHTGLANMSDFIESEAEESEEEFEEKDLKPKKQQRFMEEDGKMLHPAEGINMKALNMKSFIRVLLLLARCVIACVLCCWCLQKKKRKRILKIRMSMETWEDSLMMAMWKRKNRSAQQRIVTLVKRSVIAAENEVGYSEFKAILNSSAFWCFQFTSA